MDYNFNNPQRESISPERPRPDQGVRFTSLENAPRGSGYDYIAVFRLKDSDGTMVERRFAVRRLEEKSNNVATVRLEALGVLGKDRDGKDAIALFTNLGPQPLGVPNGRTLVTLGEYRLNEYNEQNPRDAAINSIRNPLDTAAERGIDARGRIWELIDNAADNNTKNRLGLDLEAYEKERRNPPKPAVPIEEPRLGGNPWRGIPPIEVPKGLPAPPPRRIER